MGAIRRHLLTLKQETFGLPLFTMVTVIYLMILPIYRARRIPRKNTDGTYALRFGCDGQPNNIPIREGNKTGKFNVVMRHYGPSEMVSNKKEGYNPTENIKKVE